MKEYTRHLIACNGEDCQKDGGGAELLKTIREQLGKDARGTKCSRVSCLGQCKAGPVLIVYPEGVWYRCPSEKAIKRIVEKHLRGGKIAKKYALFTMSARH
jgi:(2Fe-2S) ferredoxin